jgi:putative nucleotidyltransferase with HDIG domain
MQRVEDANRHLQELNKLYLSTIETLAMAVDAKDQITHGHIRRVQACAVGLAKAMGVTADDQLKAIEAAALLHDMGKLAIPEHILNKPGKLSSAEFETMKRHASIGADILSAIEFPYPVVPIVRHHHERWDGKGYPSGLAAADIPIGARILSVVDCFDALTSDRPYRRALSDDQALSMLIDDRGKAYDPFVVDTFSRVFKDIIAREVDYGPNRRTFQEIAEVSHPAVPSRAADGDAASGSPHVLPLFASLHAFSAQAMLADAAEEIARKLRELTPATLSVLFVHNGQTGELSAVHASGPGASAVQGMKIPVGERLSGWVAANRQTICNSDPALDLAGLEAFESELHSCLSTTLVAADSLVGVLSLYAPDHQAFTDTHKAVIEQTSRPLAYLVRGALDLEKVQSATGPGALAQLQDLSDATLPHHDASCRHVAAAISLQVRGLDEGGRPAEPILARAAAALRRNLRVDDLLYRDGAAGLLAVLPHADPQAALTIAERAREGLLAAVRSVDEPASQHIRVVTGVAAAPADGTTVEQVVAAARKRGHQASPHLRLAFQPCPDPDDAPDQQRRLFDEPPAA